MLTTARLVLSTGTSSRTGLFLILIRVILGVYLLDSAAVEVDLARVARLEPRSSDAVWRMAELSSSAK
jgi:hypothetical protein